MKSLLLSGLLLLLGNQAIRAGEIPTTGWIKVGETRSRYLNADGYINLKSIKNNGVDYTYLSSWRLVDSTGSITGNANDWSNAEEGSGNCASDETSEMRKKIKEHACKGVIVTAEQKQAALDEDAYEVKIDPMTDRKNIIIAWDAIEDDEATIIIRCKSGVLDAYIHTGTYNSDNNVVFIRWDKGVPLRKVWNPSKDQDSFFARNPMGFVQQIQRHETMAFQWEPYSKAPRARKFELRPLHRYISQMEEDGCDIGSY